MAPGNNRAIPPGLRWIGFDLDDTLHYFGRASRGAADAVFAAAERQLGIRSGDLKRAYREILRNARRGHFSRPLTAREYRAERFGELLEGFGFDPGAGRLERLLDVYDAALAEALELRPGARGALNAIGAADLSVMVVSEGPHDAQATTIDRLGIASDVDLLVTSAAEGASKSDGLFEIALARAGCEPHEVLFVGNSVERDIVPTAALGIPSVYVGKEDLPAGSAAVKLSLTALARLFGELPRPAASVDSPFSPPQSG